MSTDRIYWASISDQNGKIYTSFSDKEMIENDTHWGGTYLDMAYI